MSMVFPIISIGKEAVSYTHLMLRNTTRFLIITSLIGGLQMFEEPKLLFSGWASLGNGQTGGPGHTALTTVWKFFNDAFSQDSRLGYGSAMALSLIHIYGVYCGCILRERMCSIFL